MSVKEFSTLFTAQKAEGFFFLQLWVVSENSRIEIEFFPLWPSYLKETLRETKYLECSVFSFCSTIASFKALRV